MQQIVKMMLTLITITLFISHASESFAALDPAGMLDTVLQKYQIAARSWASVIQEKASWIFITLATISMVWTFSQLMFHRSSFAEFFGEFIRFIMFMGFFLWLLNNGPTMALAIIKSLSQIGNEASGLSGTTPSSIVDVGFQVLSVTLKNMNMTSPLVSLGGFLVGICVLIILALVGINMLLQLCAAWVLAYAGIFFLGFGGSKWTSDMAINYFKTVLGIGASLMTMTLLVGVGTGIITEAQAQMQIEPMNLEELGVLLVFSLTLLLLVDKLPAMVAGIVTGAGIGSIGGGFGAGAAVGAAMTAAAAVSGAASVASSTVTGAAGIASALKAASQSVSGSAGGTAGGAAGGAGGGAGGGVSEGGRSLGEIMGAGVKHASQMGKSMAGAATDMGKEHFQSKASQSFGGRMASRMGGDKEGQ